MSHGYNFLRFSRLQRHALVKALILLTLIRLGLWLIPFRTLHQWLVRWSEPATLELRPSATARPVRWAVWAVETSCVYLGNRPKCLARALTVFFLTRRRGLQPDLKIGVTKVGNEFAAHAWIEVNGRVVIGELPDLSNYVSLPSLEGANL